MSEREYDLVARWVYLGRCNGLKKSDEPSSVQLSDCPFSCPASGQTVFGPPAGGR